MPSARSHQLTKLKKRSQALAERSIARARQLLSAVVIASSMSLATVCIHPTPNYALDRPANQVQTDATNLPINPLRSDMVNSAAIEQDRHAVHQELEYWVFSDDFCGWASVKEILDPGQSLCKEDAFVGNDQSIEITRRPDKPVSQGHRFDLAYSQVLDATVAIQQHARRLQRECDFYRSQVASAVMNAVQPNSSVRNAVAGYAIGHDLAALRQAAKVIANAPLKWIASSLNHQADSIAMDQPLAAPEQTAGKQLLSRAGIEANHEMTTAAGVADDAANRVCCPVEQSDVAARLPATYSLAAVGVATATLKTPHAPSDEFGNELKFSSNPVSQAEALATACETAAEALESLARALRQAGDSFIRVARSGTEPGLIREPTAELR